MSLITLISGIKQCIDERPQCKDDLVMLPLNRYVAKYTWRPCDEYEFDQCYICWRGNYNYLSITPSENKEKGITLIEFLDFSMSAIGKAFECYKGGELIAKEYTPVYIDGYSRCSYPNELATKVALSGNLDEPYILTNFEE